jgi:acetylornithine/succinyldiaminopimelate/putrescine aminotransferase
MLGMKDSTPEHKYFGRLPDRVGLHVSRSAGPFVFDQHGKKILDFVAGWCVGNLGWNFTPTRDEIAAYAGPQYVHPGCSYAGWVELARLLDAITPSSVTKSFRATGGTEAVELAMQAAMLHTQRSGFVSLDGAYHGNSLATLSLGSGVGKARPLPKCHKVPATLNGVTLERIDTRLKKRDVAAVVLEPIAMNLAVAIPEPGFMKELMRLAHKHGTLLIADEVACGFGRTGRMFACDHDDVNLRPDILCLAKAIANGAAPIGATVMSAAVARTMERSGSYWSTYGWHPLSVSVAIATIRWLRRNKPSSWPT